ncbi:STAS domain-containing protein [Marinobacteraceae bacterium S3BR75-40.1]
MPHSDGGAPQAQVTFDQGTLFLGGHLDNDNIVAAREQGEQALRRAEGEMKLDLSGLESFSSVVLSLLLCWMRLARRQGIELILVHIPPKLFDMARVSGLDTLLPFASVDREAEFQR